jgi:hypothetical protein
MFADAAELLVVIPVLAILGLFGAGCLLSAFGGFFEARQIGS